MTIETLVLCMMPTVRDSRLSPSYNGVFAYLGASSSAPASRAPVLHSDGQRACAKGVFGSQRCLAAKGTAGVSESKNSCTRSPTKSVCKCFFCNPHSLFSGRHFSKPHKGHSAQNMLAKWLLGAGATSLQRKISWTTSRTEKAKTVISLDL